MRSGHVRLVVVAALLALCSFRACPSAAQDARPPDAPQTPHEGETTNPAQPTPADPKEEARVHFERGVQLSKQAAWDAALAEFLRSRRIYATKSATMNAIVCMRQLGRYDEALELTEALLREFADLTPAAKMQAQRDVIDLSARVGTIEIQEAPPGASIVIDGRDRGEFPSLAPLRVVAGTHVVRLYKEGYVPFEARVDVAGGQVERVRARLRALSTFGRLDIVESQGKVLDAVVDGSVVGRTPWSGPIEPGDHTVLLRGEGTLGTQPVSVRVRANQTTPLRLTAEELESWLRVEPKPAGASVAIDSVTVGRGIWEGQLRAGTHTIEVAAEGFLPASKTIRLERGARERMSVSLARDPRSPFWRAPPGPQRWIADASLSLPFVPTLGGDVASACGEGCVHAVGLGALAVLRGGYRPIPNVALGLMGGYLMMEQTSTNRSASLAPIGLGDDPRVVENTGLTDENVAIERGIVAGAWGGVTFGSRVPVHVGFGAGLVLAKVADTRRGRFIASDGTSYLITPVTVEHDVTFVHAAPRATVGVKLGEHIELALGVEALLLVALTRPEWDDELLVGAATDGLGTFSRETIIGRAIVAFAPGVSARYGF